MICPYCIHADRWKHSCNADPGGETDCDIGRSQAPEDCSRYRLRNRADEAEWKLEDLIGY